MCGYSAVFPGSMADVHEAGYIARLPFSQPGSVLHNVSL